MWTLSCSMWDLVPWPRIESGPQNWEYRVLDTGPPEKSLLLYVVNYVFRMMVVPDFRCRTSQRFLSSRWGFSSDDSTGLWYGKVTSQEILPFGLIYFVTDDTLIMLSVRFDVKSSPLLYLSFNVIYENPTFSHVVVIHSVVPLLATLWTAALQTPLSCTSPWVCSNSSPLSWWCCLTHLSICCPFLVSPSVFPSISSSFPMNQLFLSGSPNMGASALASVLPMHIQGWFPLGLTSLVLQSNGLSSSSPAPQFEISPLVLTFFTVQLSHLYMTTGKKKQQQQQHSFDYMDLCRKVMSLPHMSPYATSLNRDRTQTSCIGSTEY